MKVTASIKSVTDRWLSAPSSAEGTEKARDGLLELLFAAICTITISLHALLYLLLNVWPLVVVAFTCLAGCSVSLLLIVRTRRYRVASINLLFWSEVAINFTTFATGGPESPVLWWQPVFPLAVIFLLNGRNLWIAVVAPGLSYIAAHHFAWDTHVFAGHEKILEVVTFSLATLVSLSFAYIYHWQRNLAFVAKANQSQALEVALSEKRHLFRILCHDVANPLQVILSAASLGQRLDPNDPQVQKLWKKIDSAAKTQLNLITQASQLESMISGKATIQAEPLSAQRVVQESLFVFEDRLRDKNILVHVEADQDFSFMGDPVMFTHGVLNNLISNAVKFTTPGGSIHIKIGQSNGMVHFRVTDRGIGIPEEILDKVFSPTHSTSRRGTVGEKGSGFGLPLVKSYLEKVGGAIEIISRSREAHPDNHGTEVTVSVTRNAA